VNPTTGVGFSSTILVDDSNATGTAPEIYGSYFLSNPGSFSYPGTFIAAGQQHFTDAPDPITVDASNGAIINQFGYSVSGTTGSVNLMPNESFTCTVYDNGTALASGTGFATGEQQNANSEAEAICQLDYPSSSISSPPPAGSAEFAAPTNTINPGDTYTFIISH
jgi:hypothetical protein